MKIENKCHEEFSNIKRGIKKWNLSFERRNIGCFDVSEKKETPSWNSPPTFPWTNAAFYSLILIIYLSQMEWKDQNLWICCGHLIHLQHFTCSWNNFYFYFDLSTPFLLFFPNSPKLINFLNFLRSSILHHFFGIKIHFIYN